MKDNIGLHHEFCLYKYKWAKQERIEWNCQCDLLMAYDEWRQVNESNTYNSPSMPTKNEFPVNLNITGIEKGKPCQ